MTETEARALALCVCSDAIDQEAEWQARRDDLDDAEMERVLAQVRAVSLRLYDEARALWVRRMGGGR